MDPADRIGYWVSGVAHAGLIGVALGGVAQVGLHELEIGVGPGAREVLAAGGCASVAGRAALARLDGQMLAHNASPGGAADLLAATLFLDRVAG